MIGRSRSLRLAMAEWRLYGLVLPTIILVATFCYYPSITAIFYSLFRWTGGDTREFIGFDNFRTAFGDGIFWKSFATIAILVLANILKLIPSIGLAVLIHRLKNERWQYFYRIVVVLPLVVPDLVTLFVWKFFFNPNKGLLDTLLERSGMNALIQSLDGVFGWNVFHPGTPVSWLGEPALIIPSLILVGFPWIGSVGVLLFIAGLQSIGHEIYEAADLDGVGAIQKFFHIEFPLILTQVRLSLVLMIIGTLQGFGFQYLLLGENGGAGGRGMVPGLWMFNRAFFAGEFGYACALGLFLFGFILVLTWLNDRFLRISK